MEGIPEKIVFEDIARQYLDDNIDLHPAERDMLVGYLKRDMWLACVVLEKHVNTKR